MILKLITPCLLCLALCAGCSSNINKREENNKDAAEKFIRGVYGGNTSIVSELAAEDIVLSYPIFQTLFNSPVIAGKEAVTKFIERFSTKWKDPEITIEEVIAEENTVVLVWSFRAHDAFLDPGSQSGPGPEKSWGGITVYHFDKAGKIKTEFGEESEPGPFGRLSKSKPSN
jgi:hypothetical protein